MSKYYFASATLNVADEYGVTDTVDLYGEDIERVRKAIASAERAEMNLIRTVSLVRYG